MEYRGWYNKIEKRIIGAKYDKSEEDFLDYHGEAGWELVSVLKEPDGIHLIYYFKKPRIMELGHE